MSPREFADAVNAMLNDGWYLKQKEMLLKSGHPRITDEAWREFFRERANNVGQLFANEIEGITKCA